MSLMIRRYFKDDGSFKYAEHICDIGGLIRESEGYGHALDPEISFNAEKRIWFAGNGEYGTNVNYCPWCGVKLSDLNG